MRLCHSPNLIYLKKYFPLRSFQKEMIFDLGILTVKEVGFQSLKFFKEKMVYLYTNSISVHVTNVTFI